MVARALPFVLSLVTLATGLQACAPSLELPQRPPAETEPAPPPPPCRIAVTGEPIVNEVLARPGGLDLDGDGQSTHRDEAIELVFDADVPAHLQDVELWLDGARRGRIPLATCLVPGTLVVLVGATAGGVQLPEGSVLVRLDKPLYLADGGGKLSLRSPHGVTLADARYGPAPQGPATSLARPQDGDRWSDLQPHRALQLGLGQPASIGRCLDGQPACHCTQIACSPGS